MRKILQFILQHFKLLKLMNLETKLNLRQILHIVEPMIVTEK